MTKILIAEDNERNRYLEVFLLEREGFEVFEAVSGVEVLRLVFELAPDLVLLDIQMPELDGYETAVQLKADPRSRTIALVGVSSFAMGGDRQRALDVGFTGYIEKPINPETFGAQIRAFLNAPNEKHA